MQIGVGFETEAGRKQIADQARPVGPLVGNGQTTFRNRAAEEQRSPLADPIPAKQN